MASIRLPRGELRRVSQWLLVHGISSRRRRQGHHGRHQPRTQKERVFGGEAHAALVFDGDDCVGWCQFGSPDELPRIKSRREYERTATERPDWRIGCCYVAKGHRREGVATAALAGALDLISGLGGGLVEGYPEPAGAVPAGFLFNGALSTYEQLGFTKDRMIGKHRRVVNRLVESSR